MRLLGGTPYMYLPGGADWTLRPDGVFRHVAPPPQCQHQPQLQTRHSDEAEAQHAGLPASARRFSEIHTPHNLLPQQIVREEAIVYCQSINNLDC